MSKLTSKHFKGTNKKQINNYIETINDYLHENIPLSASWQGAVSTLSKYLNQYDFINHEGIEINDDTIKDFITTYTHTASCCALARSTLINERNLCKNK